MVRDSVALFSKTGKIDNLVEEGQGEERVYDQFLGGPIEKGVGSAENVVLVDVRYSYVSLMCRITPSPDWFVGADGVDLCVDSSWIDELDLELHPLDAGTASGLTFTSSYWETIPQAAVTKITSRSPSHPSSGFYYPGLRDLPAIAHLHIIKIKEYTTKEMNEFTRNELLVKLKMKNEQKNIAKIQRIKTDEADYEKTTKDYIDKLKDLEEDPIGTPRPSNPDNNVMVVTEGVRTEAQRSAEDLHNMDEVVLAVARGRRLGLGRRLPRHFRSRLHHAVNRITPDDCLVSEWSEWSPCSTTCGTGQKYRYRTVVRYPVNRGRACPELVKKEKCGAKDSCDVDYR
ncbi:Spondin-2 [Eumeta japonica]|uniref:Spondin-2 n=1 Tax=Eumeta variegata TaxID=151549 RepID=A0A4C1VMC3_EUMVA|nr:Spondin-2 [Eumeta japonica]